MTYTLIRDGRRQWLNVGGYNRYRIRAYYPAGSAVEVDAIIFHDENPEIEGVALTQAQATLLLAAVLESSWPSHG